MSIRLDMPREFDLVGNPVLIGGIGTGFEATINYRIHDGHDEVTGFITVGGGTGEHAQFQKRVAVGKAAFKLDRLFVEVFEVSAKDGTGAAQGHAPGVPRDADGQGLHRLPRAHGQGRRHADEDRPQALRHRRTSSRSSARTGTCSTTRT